MPGPTTSDRLHRWWRIVGGEALDVRRWGDECVVFQPRSGDTHLLNLVETAALDVLRRHESLRFGELMDRVARVLDVDDIDRLGDYLEQTLAQLDELGIVEPV